MSSAALMSIGLATGPWRMRISCGRTLYAVVGRPRSYCAFRVSSAPSMQAGMCILLLPARLQHGSPRRGGSTVAMQAHLTP